MDKIISTMNYSLFFPLTKEGYPDQRFNQSLKAIIAELGDQTIEELNDFRIRSEQLQKGFAKQDLSFALAVFHEADYLDKHHQFDDDNKCGFKSKVLRKQAQDILQRFGYTKRNAHKLVATASWICSGCYDKAELKWFESLCPSHLYELSRMSREGIKTVQEEVSYPEFNFCAGQQEISVRRLEEIRRMLPKMENLESNQDVAISKRSQIHV